MYIYSYKYTYERKSMMGFDPKNKQIQETLKEGSKKLNN